MPHILVVDDDEDITTLLTQYLTRFGFTAHAAADAQAMRAQLAAHPINLVVLDIMLPGTDGITLARELRARSQMPIIILTARANPYDCVLGLEMGADDYMGKPFEPRELVARIQNVLRRTAQPGAQATQATQAGADAVVRFDGWTLHGMERHLVSPQGVVVPLSNAEFRFSLMTRRPNIPRCKMQASAPHAYLKPSTWEPCVSRSLLGNDTHHVHMYSKSV